MVDEQNRPGRQGWKPSFGLAAVWIIVYALATGAVYLVLTPLPNIVRDLAPFAMLGGVFWLPFVAGWHHRSWRIALSVVLLLSLIAIVVSIVLLIRYAVFPGGLGLGH